ncbi:MAG: hypothetical protein ACTS45_01715, partial [Candidatus Hodgkinia cicadicola]
RSSRFWQKSPQLRWHGSPANEVNFRTSQRSASTAKPRPLRLSRGRRRLFSIPQVNLRSSSCGIVIKPNHFNSPNRPE